MTDDEAYNKTLMLRLIRTNKQARAQCAFDAYFAKNDDWESLEEEFQWHTIDTTLQRKIYMDYYCAAVGDESNPDLTMLERLNKTMKKMATHGNELERFASAVTKGILE
jgi:hypothetical protein